MEFEKENEKKTSIKLKRRFFVECMELNVLMIVFVYFLKIISYNIYSLLFVEQQEPNNQKTSKNGYKTSANNPWGKFKINYNLLNRNCVLFLIN